MPCCAHFTFYTVRSGTGKRVYRAEKGHISFVQTVNILKVAAATSKPFYITTIFIKEENLNEKSIKEKFISFNGSAYDSVLLGVGSTGEGKRR